MTNKERQASLKKQHITYPATDQEYCGYCKHNGEICMHGEDPEVKEDNATPCATAYNRMIRGENGMSKLIKNVIMGGQMMDVVVIESTEHNKCQKCGKTAELRPYGANGENICFECGMKDQETTKKMMGKVLFGE